VASTQERKVSTEGKSASLPAFRAFPIYCFNAAVISYACWPAFFGKELYLKGSYSGWIDSHLNWAK
jgi:hypothetical protein